MASYECPGKRSWSELLGANGEEAAAKIERENPNVKAVIVLDSPDTIITTDYLCTRVRAWVNTVKIVTRVPVIG